MFDMMFFVECVNFGDVIEFIVIVDVNGDGVIDFEEFMIAMFVDFSVR